MPRPGQVFPGLTAPTPDKRQVRLSLNSMFVPVFLLNHLCGQVGICGKKLPLPSTHEVVVKSLGEGREGSALWAAQDPSRVNGDCDGISQGGRVKAS